MSGTNGKTRAGRAAPYALVGGAAGYLYYVATQFQFQAREGTLGPDFWPKLVLCLILAVCVYELVKIFLLGRTAEVEGVLGRLVEGSAHTEPAAPAPPRERPLLLAGGIALTAAYVAIVQSLGFFTATVAYLAAFIAVGGYRRWSVVAAVSVGGTLVMLFFFMKVVYVSLPLGTGVFQQVTLALMRLLGIR